MSDNKFVNQKQFADILGKTKGYVSELKRNNRLVFNADGLVDVEKTLVLIKKTSDPSRVKKSTKQTTQNNVAPTPTIKEPETKIKKVKKEFTEEEIKDFTENEDPTDFNQSRARKEYFLSKRAENDYLKETGKLIDADLIERQYFNLFRQFRDKIFNIKLRVSPHLCIMTNQTEISNLLDKEFRNVFREMEENAEQMIIEEEDDEEE